MDGHVPKLLTEGLVTAASCIVDAHVPKLLIKEVRVGRKGGSAGQISKLLIEGLL